MLHHGVGLHFIENNAFHSLFFQKSLYAVQIPEAFDGRPADDDQGLGAGQGSGTKIVQRTRAEKDLRGHEKLKWLIHALNV